MTLTLRRAALPALTVLPAAAFRADHLARHWLRRNTRLLHLLSDGLRTVALLTPSADAELHAEAAAAALALLSLYRDLPPPKARLRTRLSVVGLSLISSAQLLLEMLSSRRDARRPAAQAPTRESQLSAVTLLEAAKLALRLSLLAGRAAQGRILTAADQALPERPPPPECTCGMRAVPGAELVSVASGPRSGRKILRVGAASPPAKRGRVLSRARIAGLEPLPDALKSKENADPLLDALFMIAYERRANWVVRMFVPDVACEACAERRVERSSLGETVEGIQRAYGSLQPGELAAEIVYIARPLVHLLLIRKFGWRSWRAWLLALMLDLGSRVAMAPPQDHGDEDERRRRMAQLLLYLGRSPLFDLVMRSFVKRLTSPLRRIPLVGGAASSAIEWVTLLQQYWFYTSGS